MSGKKYNELISILGHPKDKIEKVYFLLFCEPDVNTEKVLEISELTKNSFYNLKSRNPNIISKKQGKGNVVVYDISLELRQQIDLRIRQKLKQQKTLEKQQEEKILNRDSKESLIIEIKTAFQNMIKNKSMRIENSFVWLDLKELQETYLDIFLEFESNPSETKMLFEMVLEDLGFDYPIRFSNFEDIIKCRSIDSLRAKDLEGIQLIKCRSSILSDVRPQITNMKFECPSCGTVISVLQIEKKIREPSRCSCGRRGGFKLISKTLIDRARCELEDLTDLTESPQIKSILGFVTEHLTESKELSKLNPGSEVKVLCIYRSAYLKEIGGTSTALDVFLDILEVQPFEEVIDLGSFSKEEIKKYKNLSETIKKENSLKEIRESFAPDIIGNKNPKDVLILKQAQGRTRKNKSHILFISDPGQAKSILAKKYHTLMPGSSYTSGSGSSAVGLTATVEKKEEGWICKPGVLATTREDAVIDEFNLIGEDEKPKLQEAMSEGQITINKASIHTKLKTVCGIVACANPLNGIFNESVDLVDQFGIPPQLLNRFDGIFIIKDTKTAEEDEKIARQMLLRNDNQINQKYSDEFLKRFFLFIRSQPEPSFKQDLINSYVPKKYAEIRNSMRYSGTKRLINPRFVESIIRLSKSLSKIKLSSEVSKSDVDFAIEILKNTYLEFVTIENV